MKKDGHFLRGRHPFVAAGDHANITYVQVQSKRPASLGTASQDRLNRWCLDWSHEDFSIYTIPGEINLFNDFHSRGGAPGRAPFYTLAEHAQDVESKLQQLREAAEGADETTVDQKLAVVTPAPQVNVKPQRYDRDLEGQRLLPDLPPFDWPKADDIAAAQRALTAAEKRGLSAVTAPSGGVQLLVDDEGRIVLPKGATELQGRIVAVAHCGRNGHLSADETVKQVRAYFAWPGMAEDVRGWAHNCLLCIKLAGGKMMPRPMGCQLLGTQPGEVVSLDFMKMPLARDGKSLYVLLVVDQLTRLVLSVPTADCTSLTAAKVFVER